jgi:hypothetical protein
MEEKVKMQDMRAQSWRVGGHLASFARRGLRYWVCDWNLAEQDYAATD